MMSLATTVGIYGWKVNAGMNMTTISGMPQNITNTYRWFVQPVIGCEKLGEANVHRIKN